MPSTTDVMAPAWHEERQVLPDLAVLVLVDSGWGTWQGTTRKTGRGTS